MTRDEERSYRAAIVEAGNGRARLNPFETGPMYEAKRWAQDHPTSDKWIVVYDWSDIVKTGQTTGEYPQRFDPTDKKQLDRQRERLRDRYRRLNQRWGDEWEFKCEGLVVLCRWRLPDDHIQETEVIV